MPDAISAESGAFRPEVAASLRTMGHQLNLPEDKVSGRASSHVWGNMQTVMWDKRSGVLSGGSDPRNPVGEAKVVEQAAAAAPDVTAE